MLPTTPDNPCGPANAWVFGQAIGVMIGAGALITFFAGRGLLWIGRRAWAWWHGLPKPLSRKAQIAQDYERLRQEGEAHTQAILARMDARAELSRQEHEAWMARMEQRRQARSTGEEPQ